MYRNFPAYPGDGAAIARLERWSDFHATDVEVAFAIYAIAGADRTLNEIWEDPTEAENDNILLCLNEWARLGDIEARTYRWGADSITARED